ncbi:hypothetical protein FHS43_005516 [Streptosporangium becharense]|uniref:DoxX family protein n=1 Tax=Streptosporangium becharense TaxID=1816182 RepID=A0A7W9IB96_9ACTN|nr:DUF6790 family protein [Streptosporangium becharense]MBB2914204.1 hypothetical protein [Streptosporangium becharense]MBB5817231.1 hypothetical protein [Streptosporangium becharense]
MVFVVVAFLGLVAAALVHTLVDRAPARRTRYRVVEIWLLWFVAGGGALSAFGGLTHIGPYAPQIADSIGFAHSPFQWEVGWADIAIGTIGLLSIWNRGSFMTAAVIAVAILYWGDAAGHIMQWAAHGNTAPNNVWTIPTDILQPLVAVVLLILYRKGGGPRRP